MLLEQLGERGPESSNAEDDVVVIASAALISGDHLLDVQPTQHLALVLHDAQVVPPELPHLGRDDGVDAEVVHQERLHHRPRHGADAHAPPAGRRRRHRRVEHLGAHVLQEQLGQRGPARPERVLPEPEEGHDGHGPDRRVVAEQAQGGVEQQEEQRPDEPAALQGHQHEVREGGGGPEQAALHLAHGDAACCRRSRRRERVHRVRRRRRRRHAPTIRRRPRRRRLRAGDNEGVEPPDEGLVELGEGLGEGLGHGCRD